MERETARGTPGLHPASSVRGGPASPTGKTGFAVESGLLAFCMCGACEVFGLVR